MVDRGVPPVNTLPPKEAREFYVLRKALTQPDPPVMSHVHDHLPNLGGVQVPVREYRPMGVTANAVLPALVYYHGGGWVIGNLDSHDAVCRSLANKMGHAVLSVDYRLAPEHPWPAAAEDALCSLRWAYDNAAELGINPDRIAVGGDSAGGNLAAVVSQQRPVPLVFQMLIYPATDMTQSFASHQENAAGPVLTKGAMAWFIGHYMPKGSDLKDPLASPGFSPDNLLKGAPPALVITAEHDPLRDEGEAYGRRLIENGVPTSIIRYNGMFHSFFGMAGLLDDADTAQVLAASMTAKALSA